MGFWQYFDDIITWHPGIHLFNNHLLSSYYVQGTMLGTGVYSVEKTNTVPTLKDCALESNSLNLSMPGAPTILQ